MANNINSVVINGNLVKDAEKRSTKNGTTVIEFSIASNKKRGEREKVNFVDVTAYGKVAEGVFEYLKKGKGVTLEGELIQDKWEGKDGKTASRFYILASKVMLTDGSCKNALNQMALNGNLTRDAEVSKTKSGVDIVKFTIAVNRGENVSFVDVTYFGATAGKVAQYLTKGRMVNLGGELSQDTWKTEDGQNRSKLTMLVSHCSLLSAPKKDEKPADAPADVPAGPESFEDDDIPF